MPAITEPSAVAPDARVPTLAGCDRPHIRVISSIRRYRARFCKKLSKCERARVGRLGPILALVAWHLLPARFADPAR
jgi:hypothetical protein